MIFRMELPNRRERRRWQKESGLLKKKSKLSFDEQMEITRRAIESGKKIHQRNVERNLEMEDKKNEEFLVKKRSEEIEKLIGEGKSVEEAMAEVNDSYSSEEVEEVEENAEQKDEHYYDFMKDDLDFSEMLKNYKND